MSLFSQSSMRSMSAALLGATLLSGCATEELHPNVMVVQPLTSGTDVSCDGDATSAPPGVVFYAIRDDAYAADGTPQSLPPYRLMIDGKVAALDQSTYVQLKPTSAFGTRLPAGTHVFALANENGDVAVTSPTVELRPCTTTHVAFFGGAASLNARVMLDDPSTVPAGTTHVRLMNALGDHQPIQPVTCPSTLDAAEVLAGACSPVGTPVAYGEVFEQNTPSDAVPMTGAYWAAPNATNQHVWALPTRQASFSPPSFVSLIPLRVLGNGSTCPSCLHSAF